MRKYLTLNDGTEVEICPISFQEFLVLDLWMGASDEAWSHFLNKNGFTDPDDFEEKAMWDSYFELRNEPAKELLFFPDTSATEEAEGIPYSQISITERKARQHALGGTARLWKRRHFKFR